MPAEAISKGHPKDIQYIGSNGESAHLGLLLSLIHISAFLAILPPIILGGGWTEWIRRGFVFLVVSCPVSYTHLDVYKRQHHGKLQVRQMYTRHTEDISRFYVIFRKLSRILVLECTKI